MPDDLLDEMKALGLYGLSIPEAYGGLDLSMEDECLVAVELGRTSPAFPFRPSAPTSAWSAPRVSVMFGTDAQEARNTCRASRSGEIITSFALTEPEAGSDSANVQTRAILDGDAYVLNGSWKRLPSPTPTRPTSSR